MLYQPSTEKNTLTDLLIPDYLRRALDLCWLVRQECYAYTKPHPLCMVRKRKISPWFYERNKGFFTPDGAPACLTVEPYMPTKYPQFITAITQQIVRVYPQLVLYVPSAMPASDGHLTIEIWDGRIFDTLRAEHRE